MYLVGETEQGGLLASGHAEAQTRSFVASRHLAGVVRRIRGPSHGCDREMNPHADRAEPAGSEASASQYWYPPTYLARRSLA